MFGNRSTSTCRMSSQTAGSPVRSSSVWMASATSSRGASSSTKRSPCESYRRAPSPRTASVTRKPSRGPSSRSAVGWNCMNSRSASSAPASLARLRPAPIAPRGLVVRCQSAAIPPVARITARADSANGPPSRGRRVSPTQRPSAVASALAATGSSTRMRSFVAASADSVRVIRRPVAAPPAWTTRRCEWPPSSPSARLPLAVRVELDAELLEVAHARGRLLAQHAHRARARRIAAGGDRVRGVLLGRVAVRQRGRDPALRPVARRLGERGAAHERDARALGGRHEGGVEAGGAGSDDRDVGGGGVVQGRAGTVPARMPPFFRHDSSLEHDTGFGHPERADRIRAIEGELDSREWLGWERVEAPAATEEQLLRVHPAEYVQAVREHSRAEPGVRPRHARRARAPTRPR